MRSRDVLFLIAVSFVAACSSSDRVDRRRCEALRDHLVEVRLASAGSADDADVAQHRAAMKLALGDSFVASCEHSMSIDQLRCAMRATDLSATTDCAHPPKASN